MSIVAQVPLAETVPNLSPTLNAAGFVVLFVGPFLSVWIGHSIGIFRPPGIVGRERLASDESILPLLGILLFAVITYILVPSIYLHQQRNSDLSPTTAATTASATLPASPTTAASAIPPRQLLTITLLGGAAAFLVMLAGNLSMRPLGLRSLGLTPSHLPGAFPWSLKGIIFLLPLIGWVAIISTKLWDLLKLQHPQKHELLEMLDGADATLKWMIILSAAVLAPLYEEFLFRGHLQTALTTLFTRSMLPKKAATPVPYTSPPSEPLPVPYAPPPTLTADPDHQRQAVARWISVLLTSLFFSVVHPWWSIPPIFFLSVCLGFAYERTGNLWVPMIMHALFNSTSIVLSLYVMR